jgi:phage tail-like protein
MSTKALPLDLRQQYQWALEIEGVDSAYMTECDSPNVEAEVVEFDGAGTIHSIKHAGRGKVSPIVVKKGLWLGGPDRVLYDWFMQAVDLTTGRSRPPSVYKRDITLLHLDGDGATIEKWTLKGAWVSKIEMDKLSGKSSEFLFESATIQYDFVDRE